MLGYRSFCRNGGAEGISSCREGEVRGGAADSTVGSRTDKRDKRRRWGWSDCLRFHDCGCGWLGSCYCVCDGGGDVDEGGVEYGNGFREIMVEGCFDGDEDCDAGICGDGDEFGAFGDPGG